jgi:hypothetical protein
MVAEINQVATAELGRHRHLFGSDRVLPPRALRDGIAALQHGRCFYCHRAVGATPQADHFIPRIRCGIDAIETWCWPTSGVTTTSATCSPRPARDRLGPPQPAPRHGTRRLGHGQPVGHRPRGNRGRGPGLLVPARRASPLRRASRCRASPRTRRGTRTPAARRRPGICRREHLRRRRDPARDRHVLPRRLAGRASSGRPAARERAGAQILLDDGAGVRLRPVRACRADCLPRPDVCPGRAPARQTAAVEQPPQPDGRGQQRDRERRRRQRGGRDHP